MEERKKQEAEFHDRVRDKALDPAERDYYWSNTKFYSVTRSSSAHYRAWLAQHVRGKRVLDYACGDGGTAMLLAQLGAREVIGIDISPVSIENCRKTAQRQGVGDRCYFEVMDAENTSFPDDTFDVVAVMGVLHHLDVNVALPELARVCKPDGRVMCLEALGHNPVFQAYRTRTPHLRTEWETEHIIRRRDLELARTYFGSIETRFFHLAALLAVPVRNTPLFRPTLAVLDTVDSILLRMPAIKWWAWMVWFVLSQPIKPKAA